MADTILLTGGTGFLGTEILFRLIRFPVSELSKIYVIVRALDKEEAFSRLKASWGHEKELYDAVGTRIIPVQGDFTKDDLGITGDDKMFLSEEVTLIIHSGAEIGFQKDKTELTNANYGGTKNMLKFAKSVNNLRRFVHISTAYVAGQKSGIITEDEPTGAEFSSIYEKTKAKAEELVRNSGLPYSICRPGMIVGDSKTGWVRNFNTIYYVLKLMLLKELRVLPIKQETRLNIVPGDYVSDCVVKICFDREAEGRIFHLTCPIDSAPTAGELTDHVRTWAKDNLHVTIPAPVFMPLPILKQAGLSYNRKTEGRNKSFITNMLTLLPYFYGEQEFDRKNTDQICGSYTYKWRDYIDNLLDFACRKNFMRQTGQTVFEQAKVRRESSRYPMTFHDVTSEGIQKIPGPTVNKRIDRVTSALWAWGIRPGDRVALTGINSVDYLVVEQAIGLIGAVSVPIYYTTPAKESQILLSKSGSKWFFIGDKRMMEQAKEIETEVRIVSFSAAEEIKLTGVMSFKEFLQKGKTPAPIIHPDPEDLATIRYTSGTTGEPKGVTFRFGQLAWMGEVLTNLLQWEERNRYVSYLSFLPLSHVVEGILAAYAPYYLLAKVDYYYLNDFGALTDALPKVRPTVFFSVPRFYEKLWDQVVSNPLGKAFIASNEGIRKKALAKVLKSAVLKKAGLDRCAQLIVGSAPISENLLLQFRSLGIEVHNAYGQTEAPLITINRLGDNVIPTIGTSLPETTVTTGNDGELIVKGPQVTQGYYGLETETVGNGVLYTGDLGAIGENGHITLIGRKKDIIVTAYGKNISIPKIEEKLKDIPGVSEAVLIGEKRAYCTALLWLDKDIPNLGLMIDEVNTKLSHPEQIRKYKVIDKPLSIQAEELTPNLKVKRGNVEAHYANEIEEMYR